MALFVPVSTDFTNALPDRSEPKYWKLEIDDDGDGTYTDYTSYIANNHVRGAGKREGANNEAVSNRYMVRLQNADQTFTEGDLASAPVKISAQAGTAGYFQVFSGWVSRRGCSRTQRYLTRDEVEIEVIDRTERLAMKAKASPAVYINYTVCDPANTSSSLLHVLAAEIGLDAADVDAQEINHTLSYLSVDGETEAWRELQLMAAAYLGLLTFRYDGKLRFVSRFETGWSEPSSEHTFDDSNIYHISAVGRPPVANRVTTELEYYEQFDEQIVYQNTESYDESTGQIAIEVAAGDYWPGPGSGDRGELQYSDPDTGETWPLAIDVQTPSIGATGSDSDIEYTGGTLTLISFNGSTSATRNAPDHSEIILRNTGGSTATITKFTIRGKPLRVEQKHIVKSIDATISDNWEYLDKEIPGKYMASDSQAAITVKWWREYGKVARKRYEIETYWMPHIQEGAVVTMEHPTNETTGTYWVESWEHVCTGPYTRWRTKVTLLEREVVDTTGDPDETVTESPANPARGGPGGTSGSVTFDDVNNGWDAGDGTTTPDAPANLTAGVILRSVVLRWDGQPNLTNFDHYEVQVSEDESDWYSLENDGTDWKGTLGAFTDTYASFIAHENIPPAGTDAAPESRTLYYRVRTTTKATGVWSAWSTVSVSTELINEQDILQNAITETKIEDDSISTAKLKANSITTNKLSVSALRSPTEGLLHHWSFDETANDACGNQTATLNGSTAYVDGKANKALQMDQTDYQYAQLLTPAQASAELGTSVADFTITGWFRSEETAHETDRSRMATRDLSDYWAILIDQDESSPQTVYFYVVGAGFDASQTVTTDEWHHYALVVNADGSGTAYVDAEAVWTFTGVSYAGSSRGVNLGTNEEGGPLNSRRAIGAFDEWRMWTRALTAAEILSDYMAPQGVRPGKILGDQIEANTVKAVHVDVTDLFSVSIEFSDEFKSSDYSSGTQGVRFDPVGDNYEFNGDITAKTLTLDGSKFEVSMYLESKNEVFGDHSAQDVLRVMDTSSSNLGVLRASELRSTWTRATYVQPPTDATGSVGSAGFHFGTVFAENVRGYTLIQVADNGPKLTSGGLDMREENITSTYASGGNAPLNITMTGGTLATVGEIAMSSGGDILLQGGGRIDTQGGNIEAGGGRIDSENGDIDAGTGDYYGRRWYFTSLPSGVASSYIYLYDTGSQWELRWYLDEDGVGGTHVETLGTVTY